MLCWTLDLRRLSSLLLYLATLPICDPAVSHLQVAVNTVFSSKLAALRKALPFPNTSSQLTSSLHLLHTSLLPEQQRLMMLMPELQRPDVRVLLDSLAVIASSIASQCGQPYPGTNHVMRCDSWMQHPTTPATSAWSFMTSMQAFNLQLSQLSSGRRFGTVRLAYPLLRRAIMALLLNIFAAGHVFSQSESEVVAALCGRLHKLHRLGAQSKAIIEFFHSECI